MQKKVIWKCRYRKGESREKIIELSLKQNIPLLGVCRGMQAIGMFFGLKY